jgi:hypothetical protein
MPEKLKEVKDKYQKRESEKGSRQVSNKVCQKVQKGAERAATAKRQKVDDLQDSNKVYQKVANG